jgi:hypothetical protein
MSTKTLDYEIGDSVVFGKIDSYDNGPYRWKDGRVFRDTTWNYSVLYTSITDKQLVADLQEAHSNIERY